MPEYKKRKSKFREYTEALLTALVVALILRSFVIEAFKVPSSSMVPSILIGDHLFVNKFAYGLRIPLTKQWITRFENPKRGEIAVFIEPKKGEKDFIKRIIGLPGDHLVMNGKRLFINEKEVPRVRATAEKKGDSLYIRPETKEQGYYSVEVNIFPNWSSFEFYMERIGDHVYVVQYLRGAPPARLDEIVPQNRFFVIGDNRNRSSDSREWGSVPMYNLKGRAMFIWLSLDYEQIAHGLNRFVQWVRWDRFGHWLN